MGIELVTQTLERLTKLEIIEYLAIEDHLDCLVFVMDGLIAPFEIDDTQSGMRQPNTLILVVAIAIRASMIHHLDHLSEFSDTGRCPATIEIDNTCYAAHED
jgi:hypothetical protein